MRERKSRKRLWMLPIAATVVLALAGCGRVAYDPIPSDYGLLQYRHGWDDASKKAASENARRTCAEKKQIAIEQENVCTPTYCLTTYACNPRTSPPDAAPGAQPAPPGR